MISERQAKERELRREQILKGALSVFKSQGLEQTTMDEIAKKSGFGKATLYYYFGSKEELFIELLDRGWEMIWGSIEPVIHGNNSPKKNFIKSLIIIGELVIENPVLFEFLFTTPQMMPGIITEGKATWKSYQNKMYAVFQKLLEDGMANGEFPQMRSDLMMRAIGGLFHGLFFLGHGKKPVSEETMESFITNFIGKTLDQ